MRGPGGVYFDLNKRERIADRGTWLMSVEAVCGTCEYESWNGVLCADRLSLYQQYEHYRRHFQIMYVPILAFCGIRPLTGCVRKDRSPLNLYDVHLFVALHQYVCRPIFPR